MIKYEKEVIKYLNLPSVPKKEWDGEASFKDGVAVIELYDKSESYAVATFDKEKDKEPRIKKVFSQEPFGKIISIFVVPSYMNNDTESFDLDERSMKAAADLIDEAAGLEMEGVDDTIETPENEYFFDNIHNDEEAIAFIKAYNSERKIRGNAPKKHENIIMKLSVIWMEQQKQK